MTSLIKRKKNNPCKQSSSDISGDTTPSNRTERKGGVRGSGSDGGGTPKTDLEHGGGMVISEC